ncbi:peptide chain release factor 1 [Caproiciproducens sp. R1]|uniref:peptide chain release factor 1 n=1 Tax=Caproiciproducens sp. R1 TaxID=3435000 RepID=UPI004033550B
MFENLEVFEKRYEELNHKLYDPSVLSNQAQYTELMKEHKNITPIVEKYGEYQKAVRSMAEARELLEDGSLDKDLKEMADEEFQTAKSDIERCSEELKILLLPRDPNDDRNVIVEIRGGAGGEEAALFSAVLYRMYSMYAETKGWKTEILNVSETELGGFKEISFMITGDGAYSRLKYESGVHRVQRVPETETQGRVHTSTATVAVLPEADEVELEINPKDLQIDTYRSSGAGGQHINKTSSAIRITHLPTGTVVECQDERSQYKNKDKAMKVLRSRLYEAKLREHDEKIASERRSQVGTGDRSERIRTFNYPQGRMTDHRIGLTIYRLDDILNGSLDEIIDALITADRAAKLQNTIDNQSEERE